MRQAVVSAWRDGPGRHLRRRRRQAVSAGGGRGGMQAAAAAVGSPRGRWLLLLTTAAFVGALNALLIGLGVTLLAGLFGAAPGLAIGVGAVVALAAPLLGWLTGIDPTDKFVDRLNDFGMPIGYAGGISSDHWLGLEPGSGRDILLQLVYGLRTSLFIAFASALLASLIGVAVGVVAGWARGWLDSVINWLVDLTLAFPFLIFALAVIPVLEDRFYTEREAPAPAFRVALIIATFGLFSWTYTARLVRGQVISLREREYVEAARAAGARSLRHAAALPGPGAPNRIGCNRAGAG